MPHLTTDVHDRRRRAPARTLRAVARTAASPPFPISRPRRLRSSAAIRELVAETRVEARQIVAPMFVREGIDAPQPINSLPGVVQHTRASLLAEVRELADLGV